MTVKSRKFSISCYFLGIMNGNCVFMDVLGVHSVVHEIDVQNMSLSLSLMSFPLDYFGMTLHLLYSWLRIYIYELYMKRANRLTSFMNP